MNPISELKALRRFLLKKSKFDNLVRKVGVDLLQSKEFKSNKIKECFGQQFADAPDATIINRIITAYNKAKIAQKGFPMAYQVGNEWLPIYEKYMNNIITALSSNDLKATAAIYSNFMREDCSVGLHGLPTNMFETYFNVDIAPLDGKIFLYDAIYRYHHWKKITDSKYSADDLWMPKFGNPYGYFIDQKFVRTGAEYLHYYATRIAELIADEQEDKVVIELGGGYGGLGYFLSGMPDLTYIDFDLPENMALTAFYLLSSYPEKKVLLYGEDKLDEQSLKQYDIIIMPNFELSKFPSQKASLVFNSYSLAEMSTETIQTYIPELKRASKKHFFHVNHTKESQSLTADEFGIDDRDFKLISKTPALWNMGRYISMDEYEYLYSKTDLKTA